VVGNEEGGIPVSAHRLSDGLVLKAPIVNKSIEF